MSKEHCSGAPSSTSGDERLLDLVRAVTAEKLAPPPAVVEAARELMPRRGPGPPGPELTSF